MPNPLHFGVSGESVPKSVEMAPKLVQNLALVLVMGFRLPTKLFFLLNKKSP